MMNRPIQWNMVDCLGASADPQPGPGRPIFGRFFGPPVTRPGSPGINSDLSKWMASTIKQILYVRYRLSKYRSNIYIYRVFDGICFLILAFDMFLNLSSDVWESSTSFDHQPGACEAKEAPGRIMVKSMDNLYNAGGSVCKNKYSIQNNWTLYWTVSCWHYIDTHRHTHTYIYESQYIYIYESQYICIYIWITIYIYIYVCMNHNICIYIYMNLNIYIYNYSNIYKYIYIYVYIHIIGITSSKTKYYLGWSSWFSWRHWYPWATAGKLVHLEIETCYLHVTQSIPTIQLFFWMDNHAKHIDNKHNILPFGNQTWQLKIHHV